MSMRAFTLSLTVVLGLFVSDAQGTFVYQAQECKILLMMWSQLIKGVVRRLFNKTYRLYCARPEVINNYTMKTQLYLFAYYFIENSTSSQTQYIFSRSILIGQSFLLLTLKCFILSYLYNLNWHSHSLGKSREVDKAFASRFRGSVFNHRLEPYCLFFLRILLLQERNKLLMSFKNSMFTHFYDLSKRLNKLSFSAHK